MGKVLSFFIIFAFCFSLISKESDSANTLNLSKDFSLNQFLNASYSYAVATLACNTSLKEIKSSKNTATRMFEHAKRHGLLSNAGLHLYSNLTTEIERGVRAYKTTSYVTCGEVSKYVKELRKFMMMHFKVHRE